jgi:YHS domain-containing protein
MIDGDEVDSELAKVGKPVVRVRMVLFAVAMAVPASYALSLFMPEPSPTTAGTAFNGDGPINVTHEGVAIKGYDVVAYFTDNRPIEGLPKFEATHQGAIFRFASEANRRRFLTDPEAYVPAYGGFCALGVSNGYKDDMHPKAFDIVDGRLFFNLTPHIGEAWRSESRQYIARADANWPALRLAPGYGWGDAR